MNRLRIAIGALGVLGLAIGGRLAISGLGLRSIRLALWLAVPVLLHDGLLVPLVLALGWIGRRVLPEAAWGPATCGLVATGTLTALGAVVLYQPGADPTLPSLLDRDYGAGYALAMAIVWSLTSLASLVATVCFRRARAQASRRPGPEAG
jgi:hypothetical protein